jgi:hypothetical protein
MALIFNQTAPSLSLAQSPIAFSVVEDSGLYSASQFIYTAELSYWTGSVAASGSADYTIQKYPNRSGVGIFDFSKILNSQLVNLAIQDQSNVLFYKGNFGWRYWNGFEYVSSSATALTSSVHKTLDGYSIYPEPINQNVPDKTSYWAIMTDGPVTQSIVAGDKGTWGAYVGFAGTVNPPPTAAIFSGSYANGTSSSAVYSLSGSTDTSGQIAQIPFGVGEDNFPLATASLSSYTVNTTYGGSSIYVEVVCPFYYTPVRIQWKNRYGQFDYLNFYKVHTETFNTEQRTYQPQLGSWGDGTTLSYNQYQTTIQRYIVDTTETLDVNTDWLPESYNEILKQLLVTDEVYWMYDMPNNLVKPLSIKTNSLTFKTGVNNKLIQYTFSFDVGQTYKQLL